MPIKQRSKISALILALISLVLSPGIGQLFAGRLTRAFTLLGMLMIVALLGAVGGMNYAAGAFIIYTVFILLYLYITHDAYKLNTSKHGIKLSWYNKWYFYTIFVICFWFIAGVNMGLIGNYKHFRVAGAINSPTLQVGDTFIAKMNYGYPSGFFIPNYLLPPVIVFSAPKYTAGSFILIPSADGQATLTRKIMAVAGEKYFDDNGLNQVPESNVLVSMGDHNELVPMQYIQGKVLYILWSPHLSRIGLRIE